MYRNLYMCWQASEASPSRMFSRLRSSPRRKRSNQPLGTKLSSSAPAAGAPERKASARPRERGREGNS